MDHGPSPIPEERGRTPTPAGRIPTGPHAKGSGHGSKRVAAMCLVLSVLVVVPYLLFGDRLEAVAHGWLAAASRHPLPFAALVVGLLVADVVLPIPSSVVGAAAGAVLGLPIGSIAVWLGLTAGCAIGHWLGRSARATGPGPMDAGALVLPRRRRSATQALLLALSRAVPVASEVAVVAAGLAGMPFRRFMAITAAANAPLALALAGIGSAAAPSAARGPSDPPHIGQPSVNLPTPRAGSVRHHAARRPAPARTPSAQA